MPLTLPTLDDRRYQDLLDEALARIPVHNPEWTNFNPSDPGVTLIELFAFLTETLLYRCNQVPERNRRKFLSLLGIPLQPASPARGLVTFAAPPSSSQVLTVPDATPLAAGKVPFEVDLGLQVLPVEGRSYLKRAVPLADPRQTDYYTQLYLSHLGQPPIAQPVVYETIPLDGRGEQGVDLAQDSVDGAIWLALLSPAPPAAPLHDPAQARRVLRGTTLSLGVLTAADEPSVDLLPGEAGRSETTVPWEFHVLAGRVGGSGPDQRQPRYQRLEALWNGNPLGGAGIAQIRLPATELQPLDDLEPLEAGVGHFPPALDDTSLEARLVAWLRVSPGPSTAGRVAAGMSPRVLWVGINAAPVTQRQRVTGEFLTPGTGEPDQSRELAHPQVLPDSIELEVIAPPPETGAPRRWKLTDDLSTAAPEVAVPNARVSPGAQAVLGVSSEVFSLDSEAGVIRCGNGLRGSRFPRQHLLRASYAYSVGSAGNVGPGTINQVLPPPTHPADLSSQQVIKLQVTNPFRTWGGADAERVAEGERQITQHLRHRDRLVSADDFVTITRRTPGVRLGRVDVLPTFHPDLDQAEPGDAAGVVTLMVIPRHDPRQPQAPEPDQAFLRTVAAYLEPRRLVTTELCLRGPVYRPLWVSVGFDPLPGVSVATVTEAIRTRLQAWLHPLDPAAEEIPQQAGAIVSWGQGWPLRKPVVALELAAEVARVPGVRLVSEVQLLSSEGQRVAQIPLTGLELPRLVSLAINAGAAIAVEDLRGTGPATPAPPTVPVPIIPGEC